MRSVRRFPGSLWRLFRGQARREDGQALLIVVGGLIALLAMAGFTIDVGRVYVAQRQLQSAVDAATLAAAQDMPDPVNAQTRANIYSMAPAGTQGCSPNCLNASPNTATATVPVVKTLCVKYMKKPDGTDDLTKPTNVPCQIYPGGANSSGYSCNGNLAQGSPDLTGCNALQVSETAKVNTTFLNIIGVGSLFSAIKSNSTVLMRGGTPHPLDVEIILDVTGSMIDNACTDANNNNYTVLGMPNGTSKRVDCAKEGARSLLSSLWPCDPSLASCPVPNTNPLDKVGLEIYPGVNSGVFSPTEFDCVWTLPYSGEGYSNSTGYDVVGLSSDFRTSDAGILVGTSQLVEAISWSSCNQGTWSSWNGNPLVPQGTDSASPASNYGAEAPHCTAACTYIADVIGNAAGKIYSDQHPSSGPERKAQGVIILLSDGAANINGPNACQAAVDVANQVAGPPFSDWVFSVAYDAQTSGCITDVTQSEIQTITFTGTTGGTFTLAFNGSAPTAPITYTAGLTAGAVQTALRGLSTIGPPGNTNVNVTGNNGGPYTVTFRGTLANQNVPPIVANGINLVPSNTVAVAETANGSTTSGRTPFTTMRDIASDPSRFYCLHPPAGQTCNGANAQTLNQIFKDVGIAITGTRPIYYP